MFCRLPTNYYIEIMSRIAGFIHWGNVSTDFADALLNSMMLHMSGESGLTLQNPYGAFGLHGSAVGVASQDNIVLLLAGRLLDRTNLDHDGLDDDAGILLRLCRKGFREDSSDC